MVSGIVRFGAIASFIVDKDSYVLANFFQEHLKYVKTGTTGRGGAKPLSWADLPGKGRECLVGNGRDSYCQAVIARIQPRPNTAQPGLP